MVRDYAFRIIEENNRAPARLAAWIGENTGTDRYAAMAIVRALDMLKPGDVKIATDIYAAYGLDTKFIDKKTVELDRLYRRDYKVGVLHLEGINLQQLRRLGDQVDVRGLDLLVRCIPIQ